MNFLSICSGIGSAAVAWHPLGWRAAAFAEIEPFPCAVLAHHYPGVPNRGTVDAFAEWPDAAALDLLVGGTPCQSFSIAGLRAGLDDPRGQLMLVYLAVARRYRPRWVVWENVPGILSSDRGRAFGTFLAGLVDLGYGFAFRVLDAQYFGLAQRRKRVFVVGHLGDWRRAAAVLLEPASLSGDPAPRREAGQAVARPIEAGLGRRRHDECGTYVPELAGPLGSLCGDGGFRTTDLDTSGAYVAEGFVPAVANGLTARMTKGVNTTCDEGQTMIAEPFAELADPIAAQANTYTREGSHNFRASNVAIEGVRVRRLTPLECERLQGFPDHYTRIAFGRRLARDSPRYKALGNAMPVPVVRWIGQRIELVERIARESESEP